MVRVLGAVEYHGQKKTFYKWQPRVIDGSQAGTEAHLCDLDHQSFTCVRYPNATATAGGINVLMMWQRPQIEQDTGFVRTINE